MSKRIGLLYVNDSALKGDKRVPDRQMKIILQTAETSLRDAGFVVDGFSFLEGDQRKGK